MSTQYDAIGEIYEKTKHTTTGRLEQHNFLSAVKPYIEGANVLELACGTGFYTRKLIGLGAATVVAIDISQTMIDIAKQRLADEQRSLVTFEVGNGAIPTGYASGPFDVVLGAWFLNYASNAAELTQMFKNISLNLKAGGVFVGVCSYLTNDLESWLRKAQDQPNGKYNVSMFLKEKVPDGMKLHLKLDPGAGAPIVEFDNYSLRQEVYEKCATGGGMKGRLEQQPVQFPVMDDVAENYWNTYLDAPHNTVVVIRK